MLYIMRLIKMKKTPKEEKCILKLIKVPDY